MKRKAAKAEEKAQEGGSEGVTKLTNPIPIENAINAEGDKAPEEPPTESENPD